MVYRFELRRNPRSLLLPLIAVALVAGSVALAVLHHVVIGLLALLVAGFIAYHLFRFFSLTLKSEVVTSEDGLICKTGMGAASELDWNRVTHAGWYETDRGYRALFIYAEDEDRLLTVPPQYERLEDLAAEIEERTGDLMELTGTDPDAVADALREWITED